MDESWDQYTFASLLVNCIMQKIMLIFQAPLKIFWGVFPNIAIFHMVVQTALAIKRTFHAIYELWGFSKTKINCKDLFLINQWKLHLGSQQISKTIKKEKKKKI